MRSIGLRVSKLRSKQSLNVELKMPNQTSLPRPRLVHSKQFQTCLKIDQTSLVHPELHAVLVQERTFPSQPLFLSYDA
jgi:hypothetical protein